MFAVATIWILYVSALRQSVFVLTVLFRNGLPLLRSVGSGTLDDSFGSGQPPSGGLLQRPRFPVTPNLPFMQMKTLQYKVRIITFLTSSKRGLERNEREITCSNISAARRLTRALFLFV